LPYVICNVLNEKNTVANHEYFRRFVGLSVGSQYPWVGKDQNYDWNPFQADRILHQFIL